MAITHTWTLKSVDYNTTNNRVEEIHWRCDSADGDVSAAQYGSWKVQNWTILPEASLTNNSVLNILYYELGGEKAVIERRNGKLILHKKTSGITSKNLSGTISNNTVSDNQDYTITDVAAPTLPIPNITYTVKVATKTSAHPSYGTGSGSGYTINGVEGSTLTFRPGWTYRFDQSDATNVNHPLRFYKNANKTGSYTLSVNAVGTPGTAGAFVQIAVPSVDPHTPLYYQCSNHAYMGGTINVSVST